MVLPVSSRLPSRIWSTLPQAKRCGALLLLLAILSAALAVRLERTSIGLPYVHNPDEIHVAGRAIEILKSGDWNPKYFDYPTLTTYLHTGVDAVHFVLLRSLPAGDPERIDSLDAVVSPISNDGLRVMAPSSFLRLNRAITAVISVCAIGLTYLLGSRLAGRSVGLLAAGLLAILPLHVEHSAFATTDIPVSFLALAAVLSATVFLQRGQTHLLCLSLILCGLAAATKYNSAIVWLAPILALLARRRQQRETFHPSWWFASLVLPPLAFVAAVPFAVLDLPTFVQDIGRLAAHYGVKGHGPRHTVDPGLPHALIQAKNYFANWGFLVVFACLGAFRLLREGRGWIVFSYPLILFLLMIRMRVDFHRNLLPTYSFVAIAAAAGVMMAVRFLMRRTRQPVRVAVVGALVILIGLRFTTTASEAAAASGTETRSAAIEEVNRLARERGWQRIGIAAQLKVHPTDLVNLEIAYEVVPIRGRRWECSGLEAFVTAAEFGTFPDAPADVRKRCARLNSAADGMETIAIIPGSKMDLTILNRNPGVKIVDPRTRSVEAAALPASGSSGPPAGKPAGVMENPVLWCVGALMLALLGCLLPPAPRTTASRYRVRIAALSIGLMVSLVGGELAVRWYMRKVQRANTLENLESYKTEHLKPGQSIALADLIRVRPDDVLQYEMSPSLDVFWGPCHVSTNSAGIMGDTEYTLEKGDNTFRIAGLGDSGMAGLGVHCEDSYLSVLERNLNQLNPETTYEVLNFAVVGYNTRIEEEVLAQRASAYSPDLVVVGWCVNDTRPPNFLIRAPELCADQSYLWTLLSDRETFHRMLRTKLSGVWDRDVDALPPVFRESYGRKGVIRCFERIGERARRGGFDLLVFGPMDKWLCKALDELGIDYCNTRERIGEDDFPAEYRIHHTHPSTEGHRVLAKLLEWELRERGYIAG